jgi:hypothetical protein
MLARPLALISLALLLAAGCGPPKLAVDRSFSLDARDAKMFDLPAVSKPQKVTVQFTSSAAEVHVLVFKEEDAQDDPFAADAKKALVEKKGKEGSVTADVPANTATRVIVRGASDKTDVTLKMTN